MIADRSGRFAELTADHSHGLRAFHPQHSKDSHTDRTCHGLQGIGIGYRHRTVFGQFRTVRRFIGHRNDSFSDDTII